MSNPPPPPKVDVNVRQKPDTYGNVTARGFFSGFGIAAGILFAVFAMAVVGLLALFLASYFYLRSTSDPPPTDPVVVAEPDPPPIPQKPMHERVVDFAEQCVAERLKPTDGKVFGRGNIIESDVNQTYLVVGRTDRYVEWKVRAEVVGDEMRCGTVTIGGEDRIERE